MNNDIINTLDKSIFLSLAQQDAPRSTTIVFPTEEKDPQSTKKAQIRLKNHMKSLKGKLETAGLDEEQVVKYMEPLESLLDDEAFWRNKGESIVIFMNDSEFNAFKLGHKNKENFFFNHHFFLQPLLKAIKDQRKYNVLTLSAKKVRLFECDKYEINQVELPEDFPTTLTDRVGEDFEEKVLQFRSGQTEGNKSQYHGHGAGSDKEHKEELLKYLKSVDNHLCNVVKDTTTPLILAGVDYVTAMFKDCSNYQNIHSSSISGNQQARSAEEIFSDVQQILLEEEILERQEMIEKFKEKQAYGQASSNIEEVVKRSVEGKTQTLFVEEGVKVWGVYNPEKHEVLTLNEEERSEEMENVIDLVNKAIAETVSKHGVVKVYTPEEMPVEDASVVAQLRY